MKALQREEKEKEKKEKIVDFEDLDEIKKKTIQEKD